MGLKLKVMSPLTFIKILTRVANVMFLCKRYPKTADYESVAEQIVTRYPFMRSPLECTVSVHYEYSYYFITVFHFQCQGHIVKTLQRRFREFRRDHPGNDEGDMKVRFALKGATPTRKRKDKCDFQVPDGEDEVSFSCHNK